MIDIHCHILPGIDDGAKTFEVSLEMARIAVEEGVETIVCTPHIMPGVFDNTPVDIRRRVGELSRDLADKGVVIDLLPGSDAHVRPDFVAALQRDEIQPIGTGRYVLFEPPHNVAPPRMDDTLFNIRAAGWHPILTHPERLAWIEDRYDLIPELVHAGVMMQITAASIIGVFGERIRSLSNRMLEDGLVHVVASDAHNTSRRSTRMRKAHERCVELMGPEEAENLFVVRPRNVTLNSPSDLMPPLPTPRPQVRSSSAHIFKRLTSFFQSNAVPRR